MGIMIQKQGNWVLYKLKPRDFEWRLFHGECLDMPPRRRPDQIFTVSRLCSAFGGTSSVWCIMSCWNRVKPSQGIGIECNWCAWAEHWRRNCQSTKRGTVKFSSSTTVLGHVSQDRSRHTWKRWNVKSYPTRRTLQTLHRFFEMISDNCQKDGKISG